ncbi:hypothetical protein MJO28_003279 [Puccinia striiformis f. sp. tritici]|uniref:VPS37 C-terminal domain-containing protein n=2 Tax=Puccinia striiformis TaxID=27350 RepID=A0A2S4VYF0_9BASI|nr:hypothetical protein Pst134EB_005877 [Puccinia striiformis f. sp. tritici]KAI7959488.1 hypothetical protein MJO28_003279 [Puccinia striiformis f. sp. tritici]KAI7965251.1 hypothetical protein MJO29_003349 [Puccinia striiformis f. sp. tritici]KAI9623153.1 hypothetical protein KEM48_009583 [Puccinia striiformis f. sp. tritici PST-130]POW14564.1 hypothetical protein PSHT_07360 [Puccinia striiformis]
MTSSNQPDPHHHHQTNQPAIDDQLSREFPEIGAMSKEDLQDLLNDPDFFHAIMIRQPEVQKCVEEHQVAINRNQALAEKNLLLKPRLEGLRDQVTCSFNETQEKIAEFNKLLKQQTELYQMYGETGSRTRLLTALHESDKLSESIAHQFVFEGTLDEDQFIREYRIERLKFYKRDWIANRWSDGKFRWN